MFAAVHKVVQAELGAKMRSKKLVQELWAGYGEIVRVELEDGRSVVIKTVSPPPDDGSVSHKRKVESYRVESTFYAHYASLLDPLECRVPRCLALREADGDRQLLLEDLDAVGFSRRRAMVDSMDDVKPMVKWLAKFHLRFMGHTTPDLWPQGCYWRLDTRLVELAKLKAKDPLRIYAKDIDDCLAKARHQTLLHGDAKIANFCFSDDGVVAAVDFQYTGPGVGVRDLAYLLGSCLTEKNMTAFADDLLAYYFAELDQPPAVEREWRTLWPFCFADFERFLKGWDDAHWKLNGYTKQMTDDALQTITFFKSRRRH